VFALDVGAPLLTPPIVDALGRIYVATGTQVVKVR
jgi:hypothetical protein